jgi:hypothetical protein
MDVVERDNNFWGGEVLMRHQEFLTSARKKTFRQLHVKDAFTSPGKEVRLSHLRDDLDMMINRNGLTPFGNTIHPGHSQSFY